MSAFHVPFFCGLQFVGKKEPSGCPRAMAKTFACEDVKSFIQMAFRSHSSRHRALKTAPVSLLHHFFPCSPPVVTA